MGKSLLLILLATLCSAGGQITLKMGMTQVGHIGAEALSQPLALLTKIATSPLILGGLGLYALSMAIWLAVLSRVPLSLAYPMVAIGYVFTVLLAWLVLGEGVPGQRWAGVAAIMFGVILISRS